MIEEIVKTKLERLPIKVRKEALDYIEFLLHKYNGKRVKKERFRFDWEGELSELRGK